MRNHDRTRGLPAVVTQEGAAAAIEAALRELGLGWESPQPGSYLVKLEGQHKLATMTWLIAGTAQPACGGVLLPPAG